MSTGLLTKLLAWGLALTLLALPMVGVLNGWFASDRWPVSQLVVNAPFDHVSAEQIRAAAIPLLGDGFFAVDLDHVRAAVAKLPWVEHVEARKRWPDTIDLVVHEQQPYARWGADRLINRQGEVFTVAGANDLQALPRLGGPDDQLHDVLRFYADCVREFAGSGLVIDGVKLSPRGGWRLALASGAVIEVGRTDAKPRLKRFLDVWPRLASSQPQPPAYVDLRYENGFAMRWATAPPPSSAVPDSGSAIPDKPHAMVWPARGHPDISGPTAPDWQTLAAVPLPDWPRRVFPESPVPTPASRLP
jgi:cell division protein FtsQ